MKRLLFLIILFILPFGIFHKNFSPDLLPVTSDDNLPSYIARKESVKEWSPQWDNLWHLGSGGSAPTLSPSNLILKLAPAVPYAKAAIPFYLALGGLFAFGWMRQLRCANPVAFFVGVIWECLGPTLTDTLGGHTSRLIMMGVFPGIMASLLRARQSNRPVWIAATAVGVWAMMTELPDSGALLALFAASYFIWLNWRDWREIRIWSQAAMGTALAILLSLQIFVSMIPSQTQGVMQGSSDDPKQKWDWATQWSLPPVELFGCIAPGFFGWHTGSIEAPYWGRIGQTEDWDRRHQGYRNFYLESPAMGNPPLLAALVALFYGWRRTRKKAGELESTLLAVENPNFLRGHIRFLSVACVLTLLLAFGKYFPLYRIFYELPYMNTWRNPIKFTFVSYFCAATLAGLGSQVLWFAWKDHREPFCSFLKSGLPKLFGTGMGVGLLLLLFALVVWIQDPQTMGLLTGGWPQAEAAAIRDAMLEALLWGAGFWILPGAVGFLMTRPSIGIRQRAWASAFIAGCALLTAGEMAGVNTHYLDHFNYRQFFRLNPILTRLSSDPEPHRVKILPVDNLLHQWQSLHFPMLRLQSLDYVATSRSLRDEATYFGYLEKLPLRLWELTNVKYVVGPAQLLQSCLQIPGAADQLKVVGNYTLETRGPDDYEVRPTRDGEPPVYQLLEVTRRLPRMLLVSEAWVFSNPQSHLIALGSSGFDPQKTITLWQSAPPLPPTPIPQKSASPGTMTVRNFTSRQISVQVKALQACYLLVNDKYDSHWKAKLDGAPVEILRANYLMRAIPIPSGPHSVEMRFEASNWPLYVSGTTLMGITAWIGISLVCRGTNSTFPWAVRSFSPSARSHSVP